MIKKVSNKCIYIFNEKNPDSHIDWSNITHIRVYHACRPTNINDYLNQGIHSFTKEEAYNITKSILIQCGADEKSIKDHFDRNLNCFSDHFNYVCVNISKKELKGESGHYLRYGSEFINCIAGELNCQSKLLTIGTPTIFICDVDIKKFPSEYLKYISDSSFIEGSWDGGIYLIGDIDSSEIVDYDQPKMNVRD